MRNLFLCAIAALGVLAHAQYGSFDLVYVLDQGDRTIKRFDGATGTYLGAIGQGRLVNPKGFAIDRANRQIWVADDSTPANTGLLRSFDMFTGQQRAVADVFTDPTAIAIDRDRIGVVGRSGGQHFFSLYDTLGLYRAGLLVGGSGLDLLATGSGTATNFWATEPTGLRQIDYNSGTNSLTDVGINTSYPGGRGTGVFFNFITTTQDPNRISFYGPVTGLSRIEDLTTGHFTGYTVGRNALNQGVVVPVDRAFDSLGAFGAGILIDPVRVEVFAAPEPGTMLAVAGGLAALALRRRRQR